MTDTILNIAQVILAVLLMIVILLQAKGAGMGAIGGGGGSAAGGNFRTKRGMEMRLHQMSIIISIIFFGVALTNALI
jgi:preprotein translocase subunit SecG